MRSTCSRIRVQAGSTKSQPKAAPSRCGIATDAKLFYRIGNKMVVDITTQSGFAAGKPRMLFEGPYEPAPVETPNYDVSPDGQRFLMIKSSEQTSSLNQIVVVQNRFEELKRRVPTGK